jgi:septum site-determining protein MinC
MSVPVKIKIVRNSLGLCLGVSLDSKTEYSVLLEEIKKACKKSSSFYGSVSVALLFEGRELTDAQKFEIVDIISENTELNVVCVVDDDPDMERKMTNALNAQLAEINAKAGELESKTGKFYKGTLRNGQIIDFDSSVIVLGDVNAGAQIVSKGSIVVLGNLNGNVYAGAGGNSNAFVAALDLNPIQIRIADTIARSPDNKPSKKKATHPQIAYCDNGNIFIEDISNKSLSEIKID